MNDAHLLAEYVATGSEAAFSELIRRHLGLVHSAALRQTGDRTLAEDVSQAVFLLLARKAPMLEREVVLAGWLFRTTRFLAARAVRSEGRRRRREEEAIAMLDTRSSDDPWKRIAPELDAALARLGDAERDALLLRFGEGRSHREVGEALGIAEDAAKKRVHRGLERLRTFLVGAGVAITPAALGEILAQRMLVAPPSGLSAAIGLAVATPTSVTSGVAILAKAEPSVWMGLPWLSRSLIGLSAVAILLVALTLLRFGLPSASRAPTPSDPQASPPQKQPALAHAGRGPVAGPAFTLRVVSAETGEPIPGATVPVIVDAHTAGLQTTDFRTDAQGVCRIPLSAEPPGRIDVGINAPGWEQRFFTWTEESVEPLPTDYTLRLHPALTMGGRVVDATGRPVPSTQVSIGFQRTGDGSDVQTESAGFIVPLPVSTTDTNGKWSMAVVPSGVTKFVLLFDPPSQPTGSSSTNHAVQSDGFLKALLAGEAVTVLPAGFSISGTIVDPMGQRVVGATIQHLTNMERLPDVQSDADGQFRMGRLPAGPHRLGITADGFAPATADVELQSASVRLPEIRLQPGGVVRVRVVDPQSNPIARVRVEVDLQAGGTLAERYGLTVGSDVGQVGWEGITDTSGIAEWRGAPRGKEIQLRVWAREWRTFERIAARADAGERQIVLQPFPLQLLTGQVVAADSGEPIQNFNVIPGATVNERDQLRPGHDGTFQFRSRGPIELVRIEAEGFESAERAPERAPDGSLRCDFTLRRFSPNSVIRGVVLGLDGQPAANTEVAVTSVEYQAMVGPDGFVDRENSKIVRTDSLGCFQFPPARGPHSVVALTSVGYARAHVRPGTPVELRLQALGTLRGILEHNGAAVSGYQIQLTVPSMPVPVGIEYEVNVSTLTTTDANGWFRFDRVPPGDWKLIVSSPLAENIFAWVCESPITVSPGAEAEVHLGTEPAGGCRITGRLATWAPGIVDDWDRQSGHRLSRVFPKPQPPAGLSSDETRLWFMDWVDSPAGRVVARSASHYSMKISADGTFVIGGVAPGEYRLNVTLKTEPARLSHTVVVPPESARTTLDLGTLTLKANRVSE